jgi:Glucosyl transferase GtrII
MTYLDETLRSVKHPGSALSTPLPGGSRNCRAIIGAVLGLSVGPYARVFWWALLVTALARGLAMLPGYSIDDYGLVLLDVPATDMALDGRVGEAALAQLLHLLQLRPQYTTMPFVAFAITVWAFLATLIVRHWRIPPGGWLPVATAALIAAHPFAAELFTFRTALPTSAVALALLALVLVPEEWTARRVLGGSLWFVLALSVYQVVLHFGVMVLIMGLAIGLARWLATDGQVAAENSTSPSLRLSWLPGRDLRLLASIGLGTVGYALLFVLLTKLFDAEMKSRTALLSLRAVGPRVGEVAGVLWQRLVLADGFLNQTAKGLLWLLLAASLAGAVTLAARRFDRRSWLLLSGLLALLAVGVVWTVGIPMVLKKNIWPAARVMSHSGVLWAGVLVIAHRCCAPWGRRLLGGLSLLIVLSFVGGSTRVLQDQLRLNKRDAAKANRIVGRLEEQPGFTGREAVAVHGSVWRYPLPYATQDHDMNVSALGASWAQVAILKEVSGYAFKAADPSQWNAAAKYCGRAPRWPAPESVRLENGVVTVCLEGGG